MVNVANYKGLENLREHRVLRSCLDLLDDKKDLTLSGLKGSAAPFVLGLVLERQKRPCFVFIQDDDEIESTASELRLWMPDKDIFIYPYVNPEVTNVEHAPLLQQMKSIRALLEPEADNGIWITTYSALASPCFSLDFIDQPVLNFEKGKSYPVEKLLLAFEERGFQRQDKVEQKGDFALRGGILDIFPRFAQHPVRMEFFGDELETLREFNAITQRSVRQLNRFSLDDLDFSTVQSIHRSGIIKDYLSDNALLIAQDPHLMGREDADVQNEAHWLTPLSNPGEPFEFQRMYFGASFEKHDVDFESHVLDNLNLSIPEATEKLADHNPETNLFLLSDYGSKLQLDKNVEIACWKLDGHIKDNFEISAIQTEVLHEKNLVQFEEAEQWNREAVMADFVDLDIGDYIVHEEYGIGQFLGLCSLEKSGKTSDFLLLQFAAGSKVYVSVSQLHLVQKYLGGNDNAPELSKLGTKSWELKKKKARKAIDKIVMDIVHRQAFREKQVGHAFSKDSKEQVQFEKNFPYNETSCQISASSRIKKDMENARPMDHLLCGDVGFGKTEIAMRCAHKAILDDKQAAILAPTTVLADQHYRNFCRRMKDKADLVGLMNRFRSTSQNNKTLAEVASGDIRILIGTHRLLSKDVEFADLGVLILDEEQRFGVKQKEALKERYPDIDVLSLSATPIPRTLHMSMLGIRNISNLTIAPENRLAIRTYVREFSKGIVKHAIKRELDRGGQSYFLHNRIEDIHLMKDMLQDLFPEARIGVGHGQMQEKELSNVMKAFYDHKIDIFLSTSIIANGIDMPTANTMVINQAQLFGLSELHQIRGRIGRYNIQAYAYLLVPPGSVIPKKSLRRLRAIEEHQELGSGFKLAMKDMEIRGVGNILGEDQHGNIADIGYELYTQYLTQAINEAKGDNYENIRETDLNWNVGSTFLPKNFIASNKDRIDFYRRISFSKSIDALEKVESELVDRFGPLPKAAAQLFRLFKCKIALQRMGIKSFKSRESGAQALVEPNGWSDDLKLGWVMDNQRELAFHGETHIVLRVNKICEREMEEKPEQPEPYSRYSYYNEDQREDPLEVLEILVDFCQNTLNSAKEKEKGNS